MTCDSLKIPSIYYAYILGSAVRVPESALITVLITGGVTQTHKTYKCNTETVKLQFSKPRFV